MGTDVKMDYDEVRAMAAVLSQGRMDLDRLSSAAGQWAGAMEGGALLGATGELLAEAIRSTLNGRIQALAEKIGEIEADLMAALAYFEDGVQDSKSRFI